VAQARLENARRELAGYAEAPRGLRGLSLHAPYSCHPRLFAEVSQSCAELRHPLTLHVAESREERELYASAAGAFRPWLDGIYPDHGFRAPLALPMLSQLRAWGLGAPAVFVHGNLLSAQELQQLVREGSYLVHCPQSARWFGHPGLDLEACRALGLKLCLGTDSLASAESLSLWEQLALLHGHHAQIPVEELLAMVTAIPGSALPSPHPLGRLAPGSAADFMLVPMPPGAVHWDWLLEGTPRIHQVYIEGNLVHQGSP
jgi:cytosine/adenosine deaminase-related metal-dependent hydrolase